MTDRVTKAMRAASCFDVEDLYDQAVSAAARCDPDGGMDQCLVNVRLSLACGCNTTVNDATETSAIAAVWANRGCPGPDKWVCPSGCLVSKSPNRCLGAGSAGMCAALPSCADLAALYSQALPAAEQCDLADQENACLHTAPRSLPCGCPVNVNDTTTLDSIRSQFDARDCAHDPTYQPVCPPTCAIVSAQPGCSADGTGAGHCTNVPP
jgi:hypothetical protein